MVDIPRAVSIAIVLGCILHNVMRVQAERKQDKPNAKEIAYYGEVLGF